MDTSCVDFFSNLYVYYYYGSYTKCTDVWKEYNITCPFSKLYFIKKGECELMIDGQRYHASAGQCFLIPAHTKHSYYHINENYIEKYWMHFEFKTGDAQALKSLRLPYFVTVPASCAAEIDTRFQNIFSLAASTDTASRLREKAEILSLLGTYISLAQKNDYQSALPASETAASSAQTIHDVINYMNSHLSEKVTVEELAALLHVHPNYFIRMFKAYMGVPPLNYLNRLRVERAKSLLENTTLPVSIIMTGLGFDDISSFSSFFKRYTGYNPRLFRETFSSREKSDKDDKHD